MKNTNYSPDFTDKCLKEFDETKSITKVARANGIPLSTLKGWVSRRVNGGTHPVSRSRETSKLQKELQKKDIEIALLKELLKKTNQAWLKE